jgi:hypothetical protein
VAGVTPVKEWIEEGSIEAGAECLEDRGGGGPEEANSRPPPTTTAVVISSVYICIKNIY